MAMLKILKGRNAQREFSLDPDSDGAPCDIVLGRDGKRSDIVLTPRTVSRAHARIRFEEDKFVIYDLGSKAGTILNGGRLKPDTPYVLKHRDLISICEYIFAFSDTDHSSDSSTSTDRVLFVDDHATAFSPAMDSSASSMAARAAANALGKLAALMELIQNLRSTVASDQILEKALDSLLSMFSTARRGIIVLNPLPGEDDRRTVIKSRTPREEGAIVLNSLLLNEVFESSNAVASDDGKTICVPLIDGHDKAMGVIQCDVAEGHPPFATDDIELLMVVALQIAFAVENAILHESSVQERGMEMELGIAHEIQVALLPSERPEIGGYEFYDYYAPAKHVGGDYYGYHYLSGDRLAIVLGDVSGKGVPAALLVAKTAPEFKMLLAGGMAPQEVMNRINQGFTADTPGDSFMTLVLLVLDYKNHTVQLVNAGHLRPLLRRTDGTVDAIGDEQAGLPVGIVPDVQYELTEFSWEPGEILLLVTDGITEAQDEHREQYGSARLNTIFGKCSGTPQDVGQAILNDIARFVGDSPQSDDTCLMCIRRRK